MEPLGDKNNIEVETDFTVSDKKILSELSSRKSELNALTGQIEGVAYRCELDDDWTMRYLSSNVFKMTGYSIDDLYHNNNLSWNDLIYYSDQKPVKERIHLAVENDQVFNVEYRIITGTGEIKWVREDGKSIVEDNRIIGIEGYIHDITDIKQKEEELEEINSILEHLVKKRTSELERTLAQLDSEIKMRRLSEKKLLDSFKQEKRLNKMKTEFINVLCHEFRNPLAVIKSSSQLIKSFTKKTSDLKTFKYLDKIELNVELLANMLDKFLALEKYKTENNLVEMEIVDIDNLCLEVIDILRKNALREFDLHYSYKAKTKNLNCDENLVKLALKNILHNAVKYSPVGEQIEFIVSNTLKYIKLTIKDRGAGIKKDDLKLIFKRFYRGQNNKTVEGYGIGLSIVKKIVKLHNGKIKIDTQENKGTKVSILLPL
ncbi:MAG: ATP-binding protein [Rhodothermaceae bacterium]